MRAKGLVLVAVALGLATGTGILARNWLEAQRASLSSRRTDAPAPVRQILVAKVALTTGSFVRPESLRWQNWPDGALSPGYAVEGEKKLEDFVGSIVRTTITAGEPITDAKVVTPGNSGFLAAVLTPGMRAVSVPVTATSGISGFVFPGDRVDLILTHVLPQEGASPTERRASETVLRNIRVLAIDQKVESKPSEPVIARTTTLEVSPRQSEIVAIVQEMGRLSLSLRSLAHDEAEPGASQQRTFTLDNDVSRLLPPLQSPQTKREITVLRGGKVGEVALQQNAGSGAIGGNGTAAMSQTAAALVPKLP